MITLIFLHKILNIAVFMACLCIPVILFFLFPGDMSKKFDFAENHPGIVSYGLCIATILLVMFVYYLWKFMQ